MPGRRIVIPERFKQRRVEEVGLDKLRRSYVRNVAKRSGGDLDESDIDFIAEDIRAGRDYVESALADARTG